MNKPTIAKDTIDFSDVAKQMAELKTLLANVAEDNQTKIEFIKEALNAGTYTTDSQHIATRIAEEFTIRSKTVEFA